MHHFLAVLAQTINVIVQKLVLGNYIIHIYLGCASELVARLSELNCYEKPLILLFFQNQIRIHLFSIKVGNYFIIEIILFFMNKCSIKSKPRYQQVFFAITTNMVYIYFYIIKYFQFFLKTYTHTLAILFLFNLIILQ